MNAEAVGRRRGEQKCVAYLIQMSGGLLVVKQQVKREANTVKQCFPPLGRGVSEAVAVGCIRIVFGVIDRRRSPRASGLMFIRLLRPPPCLIRILEVIRIPMNNEADRDTTKPTRESDAHSSLSDISSVSAQKQLFNTIRPLHNDPGRAVHTLSRSVG